LNAWQSKLTNKECCERTGALFVSDGDPGKIKPEEKEKTLEKVNKTLLISLLKQCGKLLKMIRKGKIDLINIRSIIIMNY
jgi:hypothetical protein